MNNCTLKIFLIVICVIITLVGLFLAFKREKKNIAGGIPDLQDGGGNIKDGNVNFKFAIGLVLIIIGLAGAIYSLKELPGCGEQKASDDNPITSDKAAKISDFAAKSYQFTSLVVRYKEGTIDFDKIRDAYDNYRSAQHLLDVAFNDTEISTKTQGIADKMLFLIRNKNTDPANFESIRNLIKKATDSVNVYATNGKY